MTRNPIARYLLALAAFALLGASPAVAQGKGHGGGHDKAKDRQEQRRPELHRRTPQEQEAIAREQARLRDESRTRDEGLRRDSRHPGAKKSSAGSSGKVPPGWCVEGNPHNTIENCGYLAQRDRGYGDYGRNGGRSYDAAHDDFHRSLDRKYSELAAQSPLDISRRLRLRTEKQREHEDWHQTHRE